MLALAFGGCATSDTSFLTESHQEVTLATSETLFLQMNGMNAWTDQEFDPLMGVRYRPGKFVLEAENEDYWFFDAPKPLELLRYDFGRIVDGMSLWGGIAISKDPSNPHRAGAYADGENENKKVVVHWFKKKFMEDRGTKWSLSTDAAK